MTKDKALKLAAQSIKDLMHVSAEGRMEGDNYMPEELEAFSVLDAIEEALAHPDHIVDANKMAQPPLPVQEPVALECTYGYNQCDALAVAKQKQKRVLFPSDPLSRANLRMWSCAEVQKWLDDNVNKEKNT